MPCLILNVIRLVFSVLLLCAFFQPPNIRSSISVLVCVCLHVCTGMGDLMEVTGYLKDLNKSQIYNLGLVLGLDYHHVVDLRDNCGCNQDFLDAVVVSWLQKEDRVKDVSWTALITALQNDRLRQTGIADRIATQHGMVVESLLHSVLRVASVPSSPSFCAISTRMTLFELGTRRESLGARLCYIRSACGWSIACLEYTCTCIIRNHTHI